MDVKFDFSDISRFFEKGNQEVADVVNEVGQEAVLYAKEAGNYNDNTGLLRKSNGYEADESGLMLKNDAPYASYVESKGYEVNSGAALFAERKLKERIK